MGYASSISFASSCNRSKILFGTRDYFHPNPPRGGCDSERFSFRRPGSCPCASTHKQPCSRLIMSSYFHIKPAVETFGEDFGDPEVKYPTLWFWTHWLHLTVSPEGCLGRPRGARGALLTVTPVTLKTILTLNGLHASSWAWQHLRINSRLTRSPACPPAAWQVSRPWSSQPGWKASWRR